jgi:hypothetical protein
MEKKVEKQIEKKVEKQMEKKERKSRPKRDLISIKKDLLSNLKEFLNDLLETLPEEEDLHIMRIFLIDQLPIDFLIDQINKYVLPHREKIKKRNEEFFLNDDGVFGLINGKKVLHFKDIWKSNRLAPEDKNIIFIWFEQFINIMDELNSSC